MSLTGLNDEFAVRCKELLKAAMKQELERSNRGVKISQEDLPHQHFMQEEGLLAFFLCECSNLTNFGGRK